MNKLGAIKMFDSHEAAVAAGFPIQLTQEEADKLLAIPMHERVDAHRLMVEGVYVNDTAKLEINRTHAEANRMPPRPDHKPTRRRFKTRTKVHRNG